MFARNTNDNHWTDVLHVFPIQFVEEEQGQTDGDEEDAHAHDEEN